MPDTTSLAQAYAHCRSVARHYENFPVGSLLFPRPLRDHFHAVYAFARTADDFADEGASGAAERLRKLDAWELHLDAAITGHADHPVFLALADTMRKFDLPAEPFHKLLSAFRQDVTVARYATFESLRDYCARSADPVGEIVLRLFRRFDAETAPLSAEICTALQLANFWQDVRADIAKGRIYVPREDMERFGVEEYHFREHAPTPAFQSLMKFEVERTAAHFQRGAPLVALLQGRLRTEIAWVIASGRAVLDRIRRNEFDVLSKSNRLSALSKARLLAQSFLN